MWRKINMPIPEVTKYNKNIVLHEKCTHVVLMLQAVSESSDSSDDDDDGVLAVLLSLWTT